MRYNIFHYTEGHRIESFSFMYRHEQYYILTHLCITDYAFEVTICEVSIEIAYASF